MTLTGVFNVFVNQKNSNSCAPNGAQAFLLPADGETERGVKTIDKARSLISNYHGEASDSAIDDAEGIEHGFAWRGVGST